MCIIKKQIKKEKERNKTMLTLFSVYEIDVKQGIPLVANISS